MQKLFASGKYLFAYLIQCKNYLVQANIYLATRFNEKLFDVHKYLSKEKKKKFLRDPNTRHFVSKELEILHLNIKSYLKFLRFANSPIFF